jgi:hypothetical protein
MALYKIDSNVSSYARAWGLDTGNKVIEANSEAEARRLAYTLTGIPAAALQVSAVPPGVPLAGGMSALSGANVNLPPAALTDPAQNYNFGELSSGNSAAFGTNLANVEGFNRAAPANGSFTSMVSSFDPNYDPSGGAYSTFNPPAMSVGNLGGINQGQYDALGGGGFDSNRLNGGASPVGYNPTPGVYSGMYGETFDPQQSMSNPLVGGLRNQLDFANSQANAVPDFMTGAELDAAEAAQFALDQRKRDDDLREKAKQASLVSGPVRSWDSKLADITVNADGTVNLPADMWRNAGRSGGSLTIATDDKVIGRDQIEDAIRKIAELGGRDNLDRSVSNMLQQARSYYSSTPRGDSTWDKNIDSGLIDGKLLSDAGFKATWGSLADEILGARKATVEDQIPKDIGGSGVTNPWADTNPDGFLSLSAAQQKYVIDNNLKGMQEYDAFYRAEQASKVPAIDPFYGESSDGPNGFDAEALYDVGKGVGLDDPFPKFTTKGFAVGDPAIDPIYGESSDGPNGLAGTGNEDMFIAGASQGFPVPPVVLPPQVFGPPLPPAAGQTLPFNLSDQDLFGISPEAGYKRAFGNVFGDQLTGAGPLAGYFDRQRSGLTGAFQGNALVDYLNTGSASAPTGTFENFLRERAAAPTGLNSAYGQALANYGTLRGVSQPDAPSSLSYLFAPREANDVGQAYNFLQAAQRGKYSPLVSNLFQRPSYEQSFGDYTLDAQNRAKQGQSAQNFLDFAGSRFGL